MEEIKKVIMDTYQTLALYDYGQSVVDEQARKERAKETSKYIIYGASILVLFAIVMFSIGKLKKK